MSSIDKKPSGTATEIAFLRALASIDNREEIRGPDVLAELFLPDDFKLSLNKPSQLKEVTCTRPGLYEYIIARTKYFDNKMKQALLENVPQIVLLGAGYDTRPYRFINLIKDSKIFEVDVHTTQVHKQEILDSSNIAIPESLVFVSTNFNKGNLKEVLCDAGYRRDQKTLFIWEGVIYYLLPESIDDIFNFIKSNSLAGSTLCFDCIVSSSDILDLYGIKEIIEYMRKNHGGEPVRFSIEKGKTASFLSERGYKMIEHLTPGDMEREYLRLKDGTIAGRVMGHFHIVTAFNRL